MTATPRAGDPSAWWASFRHEGLLVAPSRLAEHFPDIAHPPRAVQADRLRRAITTVSGARQGASRTDSVIQLVRVILEDVLELPREEWTASQEVAATWARKVVTGESVRPRFMWRGTSGETLPVFTADAVTGGDIEARLGVGRGRRTVARVTEWMRLTATPIALLTNGRQVRLMHVGPDYQAFAESDVSLWFVGGAPSIAVSALRTLLGRDALRATDACPRGRLVRAIEESRRGQSETSAILGERVRAAVEVIVQASAPAIIPLLNGDTPSATLRDVYLAATRIAMRCVVILFAEARSLLPRDNAIYDASYGLGSLRDQLDRTHRDRRTEGRGAWPRLMALFRLVALGSPHEALPVPAYGGKLFAPGNATDPDPVMRVLAAMEGLGNTPSDAELWTIFTYLTQTRVRVRQGRGARTVPAAVDFSDLSSEFIGILYEGLLDFELHRAPDDDAIVFLNVGSQPALPFSRVDAMDGNARKALLDAFRKSAKADAKAALATDDGEEEDGDEVGDDEPDDLVESDGIDQLDDPSGLIDSDGPSDEDATPTDDDVRAARTARINEWARATVVATAGRQRLANDEIARRAKDLIVRTVFPGEFYLVRWGGTRKGSGTFYTRPGLAGPLIARTLHPLAYEPKPSDADASSVPRTPEAILDIKVCDPAMGSGSFLVGALRYLVDALVASLYHHKRLAPHGADATICRLADGQPLHHPSQQTLPVPLDHDEFDDRLRAALRRHVVERCIYGVDYDPLAVELGQMALWIETMDRSLPFGFLDHKVKPGNSLVGCWLNHVAHYPIMAWERQGGDAQYTTVAAARVLNMHVHEVIRKGKGERLGDVFTARIKARKGEMRAALNAAITGQLPLGAEVPRVATVHGLALRTFEAMHDLPVHEAEARAIAYRDLIKSDDYRRLKLACDRWCATWFWPGDALNDAPTPTAFHVAGEADSLVATLAARHRFFHWELEFPDVFTPHRAGFDAILGNPPWEVQKPNSKEFFSNIDPLYRTYGKQEALARQADLFREDPAIEASWVAYNADNRAMANWVANAAGPWGDPEDGLSTCVLVRGPQNGQTHDRWRAVRRAVATGYADGAHPYRHQGSADLNTYKLFLEAAHALLRHDGRLGFVVPAGIYSDYGTRDLRRLFLDTCRWEWVFGFENRDKLFDIHSSFKFCVIIVAKGGHTEAIRTAFMHRSLDDWREAEVHAIDYPRAQVTTFSPTSGVIVEVRNTRDLAILDKMYRNGVLLGDNSPRGWGVTYQREVDMTNDSRLFPPLPWWEGRGFVPDEIGHWIKGPWRPLESFGYDPASSRRHPRDGKWHVLDRPDGVVLSRDGTQAMHVGDLDEVALPLYEGRMIGQHDCAEKAWISGSGRRAVWETIDWFAKIPKPQYLMLSSDHHATSLDYSRLVFLDVSSATNQRTMISAIAPRFPAGNKTPILFLRDYIHKTELCGILNSFCYDFALRQRFGGLSLNWFILSETSIPASSLISLFVSQLNHMCLANARIGLGHGNARMVLSALSRLRLMTMIDALVFRSYALEHIDVAWILRDCDHPIDKVNRNDFARTLDPKGFWRVDKEKHPELRHTVLAQVAFQDLQRMGLDAFLAQNDGEGWMLPETLRLADYGLGHDDRARVPQPVASALGPRFLPWQLEMTAEESWEECRRYAALIDRINPGANNAPGEATPDPDPGPVGPTLDLFGNPVATDLFGNPQTGQRPGRGRR
jgi:hypothetical protein